MNELDLSVAGPSPDDGADSNAEGDQDPEDADGDRHTKYNATRGAGLKKPGHKWSKARK